MSPVIINWCEEKQYSVIPMKCVILPSSLDSFSIRGTCCWPGGGRYDADILKTGGKLAKFLLVASLLPVVISLVLACSVACSPNKLTSNNFRCFAGFPTRVKYCG